MSIDLNKNKLYYNNYKDMCDCIYCKFYRQNIKTYYKDIDYYLSNFNIDIIKPHELSLPSLDSNGNLIYDMAQYVSLGSIDNDNFKKIGSVNIGKAEDYPPVDVDDNYFVLDIYPIVFGKNVLTYEIIEDLLYE